MKKLNYKRHLIPFTSSIKETLFVLNDLSSDAIVFVVDDNEKLIGSVTDGDVRRGLLRGLSTSDPVKDLIQNHPRYIKKGNIDIHEIIKYREGNYRIIPVLDKNDIVVNIVNFREVRSYLPVDTVIMAGGRGERLKPFTNETPKPLLLVGDKPIIEHNIDRLSSFGIDNYWISIRYLGEQIEEYFNDGSSKNIDIKYVWENEPLGTIGALSQIDNFEHDHILVTNSDILTNLDYEKFYLDFLKDDVDLAVVTIPYDVNIPYAVLETEDGNIKSFQEKPTYTYFSNGGIYLMKKEVLEYIPHNQFFNATDLMEELLQKGLKVTSFPLLGYWLDIGKHSDFEKAQKDIHLIKFD